MAYFGVQSGLAQVKALEAAEGSSKLALEATQLGYRVGVRVNLDVLNAQTQLFQTQRDLAKARYDVLVGTLQAAPGLRASCRRADVDAINALLALDSKAGPPVRARFFTRRSCAPCTGAAAHCAGT